MTFLYALMLTAYKKSTVGPNSLHASQNRNEGATCFWSHGVSIILYSLLNSTWTCKNELLLIGPPDSFFYSFIKHLLSFLHSFFYCRKQKRPTWEKRERLRDEQNFCKWFRQLSKSQSEGKERMPQNNESTMWLMRCQHKKDKPYLKHL